jgi:hypothetical protein
MGKQQKISEVQATLPQSEVFPVYIREMLLRELPGLADKQLDLLIEILNEEKKRLSEIS